MREPDDDLFAAIKAAEIALLTSATRRDSVAVARILHPRFVEIRFHQGTPIARAD